MLEGGLLWRAASQRGEKLLLQENLQGGWLIGHPEMLAVIQVSCCSFWNTSVKETPSTSPHMPQHDTAERATVKHFVLIWRCLKAQGGQEQDASWPAAISPFRQAEVGPFKSGTCQCPALGTLICVQAPPSNTGWNRFIWLKCPSSAKTWGMTLKLGAQKEKLDLSHAFSVCFFYLI